MNVARMRHAYGLFRNHDPVPTRPAAVLSRDPQPMKNAVTARWGLAVNAADLAQLKLGFQPQQMEDKWVIAATGPTDDGIIAIHIIRSWNSAEVYTLHVRPSDDGTAVIESLAWERGGDGAEVGPEEEEREAEQSRREVVILCRLHAGCEFEDLPEYDPSIFWSEGDGDGEGGKNNTSG
ncbi:hypothetical protein PspLS_11392 [Pyricularia sp. CBS 133598]|nr:hypothetical protein PspLS_11392 [Pyricularia sp. CBS 133598]